MERTDGQLLPRQPRGFYILFVSNDWKAKIDIISGHSGVWGDSLATPEKKIAADNRDNLIRDLMLLKMAGILKF